MNELGKKFILQRMNWIYYSHNINSLIWLYWSFIPNTEPKTLMPFYSKCLKGHYVVHVLSLLNI